MLAVAVVCAHVHAVIVAQFMLRVLSGAAVSFGRRDRDLVEDGEDRGVEGGRDGGGGEQCRQCLQV
jgi:hypothetical protein